MSKKGVLGFSISCLVPKIFKFLTYYKSSIKRPPPAAQISASPLLSAPLSSRFVLSAPL